MCMYQVFKTSCRQRNRNITEYQNQDGKVKWNTVYSLCSKIKTCGEDTIDGCGTYTT